jgi:hypothetical protein
LAVLAAEVMTVTNPLAFQTVLGWPGLQTIARFHYCLFSSSLFLRLILHHAGASCGGIGLWGAWQGRECTFISQAEHVHISLEKAPEEKCPRLFML